MIFFILNESIEMLYQVWAEKEKNAVYPKTQYNREYKKNNKNNSLQVIVSYLSPKKVYRHIVIYFTQLMIEIYIYFN